MFVRHTQHSGLISLDSLLGTTAELGEASGCASVPGGEEPGRPGRDRGGGHMRGTLRRSLLVGGCSRTEGAWWMGDPDKAAWTRARGTERSGERRGACRDPAYGGRGEAALTCTRVRMTSMGLVRTEAVAAARGPETA